MDQEESTAEQQENDGANTTEPSGSYKLGREADRTQSEKVVWIDRDNLRTFSLFERAKRAQEIAGVEPDDALGASIHAAGGIDPIRPLLVRPAGDGNYEVIRGNRLLVVGSSLGFRQFPVIVRPMCDAEALHEYGCSNNHEGLLAIEYGVLLLAVEKATWGQEGGVGAAAVAWGITASKASKLRGAARVAQAAFPDFAGESGLGQLLSRKIESLYEISTLEQRHWLTLGEHVRRGLTRERLRERIAEILHPAPRANESDEHNGNVMPDDGLRLRVVQEWRYPAPAPEGYRWIEMRGRVIGIELLEAQPAVLLEDAANGDERNDESKPEAMVSIPTMTRFDLLSRDGLEEHIDQVQEADADLRVTVSDMETAVRKMTRVEPTTRLSGRVREVAPGASIAEAWDAGNVDPYQVVFGEKHAAELRSITGKPFAKAKAELRGLGIAMADKVRTTQQRKKNQGKPIVLLVGEHVLGVGRYDDVGKAPTGQVFVVIDGYVVLVDAKRIECERVLIFRAAELVSPDSPVEAAAAE